MHDATELRDYDNVTHARDSLVNYRSVSRSLGSSQATSVVLVVKWTAVGKASYTPATH